MKKSDNLPKAFYEENRKKFFMHLDNLSAAVFFAGEAPYKSGDDTYIFTPNRNFLYLTGLDKHKLVFFAYKIVDKTEEILFIERSDEKKAKWVGRSLGPFEAQELSGIRNIRFLDEFPEVLSSVIYANGIENLYIDLENRFGSCYSPALRFYEVFSKNHPGINLKNGGKILYKMRAVKSDAEIEQIKRAVGITGVAIEHIMNNMAPDMYEYQIESCFDFALKYNGVKERAFDTVVAGGANATVLHYNENSALVRNGDLVLFDLGAAWNYYSADISRTFPANGKFTDRQKELYNIVLMGQEKVLEAIKPGVTIMGLDAVLREHYKSALKNAGLFDKNAKSAELDGLLEGYYWHKVGHSLGLDTHDCAPAKDVPLEPGMVITVEPGLYVENEGIGIRIEDDILITENGYVNLSAGIPKTVEEIEAFFMEASLAK